MRRSVTRSTFLLQSLKVGRLIFGEKIAPALEPFQSNDSSLVLLLLGRVNGELKILQNHSKTAFEAKGRQRIADFDLTLIYIHT